MTVVKITDIAKEFQLNPKDFITRLNEAGFKVSQRAKTLSQDQVEEIRARWGEKEASLTETRKGDMLEKRVKGSVIRRRRVEGAPEVAAQTPVLKPTESEPVLPPISAVKLTPREAAENLFKQKTVGVPPEPASAPKIVGGVRKPKINIISTPQSDQPAEAAAQKPEKSALAISDEGRVEELAKKRRKAFLKKRAEEFDLTGFNRLERIFQAKKKKVMDKSKMKQTQVTTPGVGKRIIKMGESIVVSDLASQLKVKTSDVIKKLISSGMMATANQAIDADTAGLVAGDFNYEIKSEVVTETDLLQRVVPAEGDLKTRPPVVTVMGHVDHGKTTLLDVIRKTNVAQGEAGGITQHIGAYMVELPGGRKITFIDTPGHEAFSAMRARGAQTTDIVILVVAADDGIMPQTREAVAHARQAKVPIVVAINKIDKPGADPEKVKKALTELELVPEEWGGDTVVALVSAKQNKGIKELLEVLLIQADVLELKADPNQLAEGVILEAKLAKGLGAVATVLVQKGTLHKGDTVVMGGAMGRVRLMLNDRQEQLREADPSTAVEISGLTAVPQVGEHFYSFHDEKEAEKLVEFRRQQTLKDQLKPQEKMTLEGLYEKMKESTLDEIKFVVKADVQGSLEVVRQTIQKLSHDKMKMTVIYDGVGAINESDVNLAASASAILIGFNIRPDSNSKLLIKVRGVDCRLYTVIYDVSEDLKKAMVGKLAPTFKEVVIGQAEVRNTFNISGVGTISGCMVTDGKILRTASIRLLRDSKVVNTGKISSLKRFKNDAREVLSGYECGIGIENYNDVKVGDVIEAFILEQEEQKL